MYDILFLRKHYTADLLFLHLVEWKVSPYCHRPGRSPTVWIQSVKPNQFYNFAIKLINSPQERIIGQQLLSRRQIMGAPYRLTESDRHKQVLTKERNGRKREEVTLRYSWKKRKEQRETWLCRNEKTTRRESPLASIQAQHGSFLVCYLVLYAAGGSVCHRSQNSESIILITRAHTFSCILINK